MELIKKLQVKDGMRLLLLNAPEHFEALLGELSEGVSVSRELGDGFDAVLLFAKNQEDLNAGWATARDAVVFDGLLWIAYPKRSSKVETDLTRDSGWACTEADGYRPIRQVAVDVIWSALRFRPTSEVGK